MRRLLPLFVAFCVLYAEAVGRDEITVLAAASLTDALTEIGRDFESATGTKVHFSFAGSGTLARQVEEGVPADLFFSADEARMDALETRKLIVPGSRRSLLSNSLAIIGRTDSRTGLLTASSVALAEPSSVPAGIYAKRYLESVGLWERIAPKVIPTENVRGALAAVEAGNAEVAIVYATDARGAKVRLLQENPWPEISYPAALIAGSDHPAAAQRFLDYLSGDQARAVFLRHGFLIKQAASTADQSQKGQQRNRAATETRPKK